MIMYNVFYKWKACDKILNHLTKEILVISDIDSRFKNKTDQNVSWIM